MPKEFDEKHPNLIDKIYYLDDIVKVEKELDCRIVVHGFLNIVLLKLSPYGDEGNP